VITRLRPAGPFGPAGRASSLKRLKRLRRNAVITVVAAALVAPALYGARAIRRDTRTPAAATLTAGSRTPRGITGLQQRLHEVPKDYGAWAALGSAYVQEARMTGDPSFYPKAEKALRRSLDLETDRNFEAMAGMGALAAARHDFAAALAWGERSRAINPHSAGVYGVIGDALIELGRYPEGFAALQRMVDLRPGLSSYARASYAWELQGNDANAVRALELALEAATTPADAAYAAYYLGELAWNSGRLPEAARRYRESVARDPTFVPGRQGIAKTDAARGDLASAIAGYESVVARLPLPQYVIELGDLYTLAGNAPAARRQLDLLHVHERILRANGVNIDLEQALFDADHGNAAAALHAAQAEWTRRRSVFVADALAWALYASGRYEEALSHSVEALRLGTRNALFVFHKAMIERTLGMRDAARADLRAALTINPHFSFLWASEAKRILEELR
jgi:tetratricopeptide (TPR) repeat protein